MTKAINQDVKVLIIGAGPSGCIAGALLKNKGYKVTILERQLFPRFSINFQIPKNDSFYIAYYGTATFAENLGNGAIAK